MFQSGAVSRDAYVNGVIEFANAEAQTSACNINITESLRLHIVETGISLRACTSINNVLSWPHAVRLTLNGFGRRIARLMSRFGVRES